MIRVAVVDNHEAIREGLVARLSAEPDLQVVASAAAVEEQDGSGWGADLVLLDLWLAEGDSLAAIPALCDAGVAVLLYTSEERPAPLRRAVAAGAAGLLLKNDPMDTVIDGIRQAANGEFYCSGPLAHALLHDPERMVELSQRQIEILHCLADGLDYRGAARVIGASEAAVKTHLARARAKFRGIGIDPGNAHDLVRLAREQGHLGR